MRRTTFLVMCIPLVPQLVGCDARQSDAALAALGGANQTPAGDAALTISAGHRATVERVLLLSIDGLHEQDLSKFMSSHPSSQLAGLAQHAVQYTNAWVNRLDGSPTNPTDSFPGLLALTSGGSSPATGVWYDVSYARDLYPDAECAAAGTVVAYDEGADRDNAGLWGDIAAGTQPTHDPAVVRSRLDPAKLPYRKSSAGCEVVYPHAFLRVNTIFEVAHAAGLHTAWSDKHLAYEFVSGPSGSGLDDLFAPEINSLANNLPDTGAGAGEDFTTKVAYTEVYDDFKVHAILRQIAGEWSDAGLAGATDADDAPGVPAIFGMNFQAVSVAQKDALFGPGGYADASGTPSAELGAALEHTDASIGAMVAALKEQGLLESTLLVVSTKHGQSPIDPGLVAKRDGDVIGSVVDASAHVVGQIADDVALYWLADSSQAALGTAALEAIAADGSAADPAIDRIFSVASPDFVSMFGDPAEDPRTPDIIVQPQAGTIYSLSTKKLAEHGGFSDDDAHVGLLLAHPAFESTLVSDPVRTQQVAPTILQALGLDPTALEAVQRDAVEVLPQLPIATRRE